MIWMARIGFESCNLPLTRFLDQALSPEMGMANSVDKALRRTDYREPDRSDKQEPKTWTIGNRKRLQTRRNAGTQRLITILTTILIGLLLTRVAPARGSSALWGAPSPRAFALDRCNHSSTLLGVE